MRVPSNLLRNHIATINRRVTTGAGNIDTLVASDVPARVEWESEQQQTQAGTVTRSVAVIYCRPLDLKVGDRITLGNQTQLEIRFVATIFAANGTTPTMLKVKAW